ncbi:MAG: hypothetical protein JWR26_4905 [Pedosphaera sp.]|nr:hypothetical protein [Pedosphaera sp.]
MSNPPLYNGGVNTKNNSRRAAKDRGGQSDGSVGSVGSLLGVLACVSLQTATMRRGGLIPWRQEKGEFNHKPLVRDRDRIDRREKGGCWHTATGKQGCGGAVDFVDGVDARDRKDGKDQRLRLDQGQRVAGGAGSRHHQAALVSDRLDSLGFAWVRLVPDIFHQFFWLQGSLRTATMHTGTNGTGRPRMRGAAFGRHEEAFGCPQGGQATNFGRVGSPKCLLMLPCACLYRLFFESFIGVFGVCTRPLWGSARTDREGGAPGARLRWKLRSRMRDFTEEKECQQSGGGCANRGLGFPWALGEVALLRPGTVAVRCKGGLADCHLGGGHWRGWAEWDPWDVCDAHLPSTSRVLPGGHLFLYGLAGGEGSSLVINIF